ncbi:hypothetical protein [Pseudarthrobacter sp. S3]
MTGLLNGHARVSTNGQDLNDGESGPVEGLRDGGEMALCAL